MTKLELYKEEIKKATQNDFNWNDDNEEVMERIEEMNFKADVEGDNIYMEFLMTVQNKLTGEISTLSIPNAEIFYLQNKLPEGEEALTWVSMLFNTRTNFLKIFVSRIPEIDKLPIENFATCFTKNKDMVGRVNGKLAYSRLLSSIDISLTDAYAHKDIFMSLKDVIDWLTIHTVEPDTFYLKIHIPLAAYYADAKEAVRNDEYSETVPSSIIAVEEPLFATNIPKSIKEIITGIGLDNKYYREENTLEFTSTEDYSAGEVGKNFLYTVLKYAKEKNVEDIVSLKMSDFSNSWEDGEENKLIFKICKVGDKLIFELTVRESGLVYVYERAE